MVSNLLVLCIPVFYDVIMLYEVVLGPLLINLLIYMILETCLISSNVAPKVSDKVFDAAPDELAGVGF